MLKNLSFRTKIAAVVVPPVAVLIALTAVVVTPRLRAAATADKGVARAELTYRVMELTDAIQVERSLAARFVASGGTTGQAEWTAKSEAADAAARAAVAAIPDELNGTDRAGVEIAQVMDTVAAARTAALRRDADALAVVTQYEGATDRLVNEVGRLVDSETNGDLVNDGQAAQASLAAKDAFTGRIAVITAELDEDGLSPAATIQVAKAQGREEAALRLYRSSADADLIKRLNRIFEANEVRTVDELTERVLAGKGGTINPETWWAATTPAVDTIASLDDASFANYRDNAAAQRRLALTGALRYGILAGLATLLAILFAVVQGRSLVRRLRSISDQAHTIAAHRLPEVLDTLRNPSEELTGALPTVIKDADDEIGSMAESFNTVLRASVHTSLEHAQRRAQTVTNMLVNLGRRNQTLIDRQLEIMDRLEAEHQDPALLEDLFKLDHLITRMRRNAENLLVLAAEQPARNWSQPVPLSDVLRGATAEVADIQRIRLEMGASEKVDIAGRFAVDLSHLVAELVENACAYSPPNSPVVVRVEGGMSGWRIWVLDAGIGMTESDLAEANQRLAEPPDIDALTTDRVGFQVVGRLGRRLGVSVRLQTNPGAGLASSVLVPPALFATPNGTVSDSPRRAAPAGPSQPTNLPSIAEALGSLTLPDPVAQLPQQASSGAPALSSVVKARVPQKAEPAATPAAAATAAAVPAPAEQQRPDSRPGGFNFGDRSAAPSPGMFPAAPGSRGEAAPAGATMFNQGPRTRLQPAAQLPTRTPTSMGGVAAAGAATAGGGALPARPIAPQSPEGPVTDDGLAMRTPGRTMATNAAAASAEEGSFRRLPMPGEPPSGDDDAVATRRLRMIGELRGGVDRGRTSDEPGDSATPAAVPGRPAQAPTAPPAQPAQSAQPAQPAAQPVAAMAFPAPEPTSLFAARTAPSTPSVAPQES